MKNSKTLTDRGVPTRWEDNPFTHKEKQPNFYLSLSMYVVHKCSIQKLEVLSSPHKEGRNLVNIDNIEILDGVEKGPIA